MEKVVSVRNSHTSRNELPNVFLFDYLARLALVYKCALEDLLCRQRCQHLVASFVHPHPTHETLDIPIPRDPPVHSLHKVHPHLPPGKVKKTYSEVSSRKKPVLNMLEKLEMN